MRTLLLIPVAYVCGIEGFGIFMPYLLFVCFVAAVARMIRQRPRQLAEGVTVSVPMAGDALELEAAGA